MKLSLKLLKQMVNEEINRSSKVERQKLRETKLIKNALRLLKEVDDDSEYDPGQGEGESQASLSGSSSLSLTDDQLNDPNNKEVLRKATEQLETADGGLSSKINQTKALKPTVKWLNQYLDPRKNPEGEEVAVMIHKILGSGTKDGDNDQKITAAEGEKPTAGTLIPTQGEIDLFKSVGHPLTNPKSFMDCYTGDPHGGNKSIVIAGEYVLDGHHRWSTIACILGPSAIVNATNFDVQHIKKEASQQILAVAQVAIVGSTEFSKLQQGPSMVPLATTSKVTTDDGTEIQTNILGSKDNLKVILQLIEDGKADLSSYDDYCPYPVKTLLSDEYLDFALFGTQGPWKGADGFPAKIQSQYGLKPLADKNSFSEYSDEEKSAVRKSIVDNLIENWGGCNSDITTNPDRNVMPQFDGGETHGKYKTGNKKPNGKDEKKKLVDDQKVFDHMKSGETNYKPQWVDPKQLEESIDLNRWNKLAGLLKD